MRVGAFGGGYQGLDGSGQRCPSLLRATGTLEGDEDVALRALEGVRRHIAFHTIQMEELSR